MEKRRRQKRFGVRHPDVTPTQIVFVVAALIAFAVTLQISVAGAFRTKYPALALAWVPLDAEARGQLAANLVSIEPSQQARQRAVLLARDAIRRSPLESAPLRALALAEKSGSFDSSPKVMDLLLESQRLSRRDRATQLQLFEQYLLRNDISAAMRSVDVVLRTSSDRTALFSLLTAASADNPAFAIALKDKLSERPEWAWPFTVHLISESRNGAQLVSLSEAALDPTTTEGMQAVRALLQKLAELQEYDLAWNLLSSLKLAKTGTVTDGDFEGTDGFPPFWWMVSQEGDFWAERDIGPEGRGRVLRLVALSGRAGDVARQLVRLAPGAYRISAVVGDVPNAAFERPTVRMYCANQKQTVLLGLRPSSSGVPPRQIGGRVVVPQGCSFQWLAIHIAGDRLQADAAPWIDDIRLTPLGS